MTDLAKIPQDELENELTRRKSLNNIINYTNGLLTLLDNFQFTKSYEICKQLIDEIRREGGVS